MGQKQIVDGYLTRYWFAYPELLGFGVTAYSIEDAYYLLEAEGYLIDRSVPWITDVDVSRLDPGHVQPNAGPSCLRGVWFPCHNIGWGHPGAHHPSRGSRVVPAPPFICRIQVETKKE